MKSQVKFGCRIFLAANEPFQQIIQRAQFCEKHGFDSILVDDHLLYRTEKYQGAGCSIIREWRRIEDHRYSLFPMLVSVVVDFSDSFE